MLLTSIPYFRQVIVMSFRCEHCGATNNETQTADAIRGSPVGSDALDTTGVVLIGLLSQNLG